MKNKTEDIIESKPFKIKGPDDIYCAVGKIIQQGQEWEIRFRKLCNAYGLSIKNLETSTLNKMNNSLLGSKQFKQQEHDELKKVIDLRNEINHEYFLKDGWSSPYDKVEANLNSIYDKICDGIDYIDNKLDELDKIHYRPKRPTVIEEKIRSKK